MSRVCEKTVYYLNISVNCVLSGCCQWGVNQEADNAILVLFVSLYICQNRGSNRHFFEGTRLKQAVTLSSLFMEHQNKFISDRYDDVEHALPFCIGGAH